MKIFAVFLVGLIVGCGVGYQYQEYRISQAIIKAQQKHIQQLQSTQH